jgi:large subunit ribosomal protein L18e
MKPTGSSSHSRRKQIRALWKANGIYRRASRILSRPSRITPTVNLWRIAKFVKPGDIILVPGKVLGDGELSQNCTLVPFAISTAAKQKVLDGGAKLLTITELLEQNPKGTGVRLII